MGLLCFFLYWRRGEVGLAEAVKLFLRAAEVTFGLRLKAEEEGQDVVFIGAPLKAVDEGVIGSLANAEFGFSLHWCWKIFQVVEAVVKGLEDELRKEAGFETAEPLQAELALGDLVEPEILLDVGGLVELAQLVEAGLQVFGLT